MRILVLEPYGGGSHQAFVEGWRRHSRHEWTVLSLPAHHWKWRMRHAAITLAQRTADLGGSFDVLLCSDMLALAEYRGLAPAGVGRLPAVAYFHENQLTYPDRHRQERDHHFAFSNLVTILAADATWFNSGFHRQQLAAAAPSFLARMPDFAPRAELAEALARSEVQPPGIEPFTVRPRAPGPLRLLWAARWEHDKNPSDFFAAVDMLVASGLPFRMSVAGQSFAEVPAEFAAARLRLGPWIDHWGFAADGDYRRILEAADAVVSTAHHEFFGLSVVEAVAAGAFPVVPRRLAYPEVLDAARHPDFFYAGDVASLGRRLVELARRKQAGSIWGGNAQRGVAVVERLTWSRRAAAMDTALDAVAS